MAETRSNSGHLTEPMAAAKIAADRGSPALEQVALADFVTRGEFDRHCGACARSTAGGATRCWPRWPGICPGSKGVARLAQVIREL